MITQRAPRPAWRIAPADLGHKEMSLPGLEKRYVMKGPIRNNKERVERRWQ
jgi:hypothetical protein